MSPTIRARWGVGQFFGEDAYPVTLSMVADRDPTAAQIAFIHRHLPPNTGTVLDAGCGVGRHALGLAPKIGKVVGLDVSLAALRTISHSKGLALVQAQVERTPFASQAFDAVLSIYSSITTDLVQTLTELRRITSLGGTLIVDMTNDRGPRIGAERTGTGWGLFATCSARERRIHLAVSVDARGLGLYGFTFAAPSSETAQMALRTSGWVVASMFGDYNDEKYCPSSSPRLVIVACAT